MSLIKVDKPENNNLTLTSVVFESSYIITKHYISNNLTLTSVVFECREKYANGRKFIFNFNKCCI